MWTLEFAPGVDRDLSRIDRSQVRRITKFLRDRIQHLDSPRFIGSPLKGKALKKFWKYRVGDYRIICYLDDAQRSVQVIRIKHRSEIYR